MKIAREKIFEVIRGGQDAYIQSLPYKGKSIEQVKRLLPSAYDVEPQWDHTQKKIDKNYKPPEEYPDDSQYAVFPKNDPEHIIIHLYVNNNVVDDTLEVYK